jgi:hypothetical protein
MARQFSTILATDFPEVVELQELLSLARVTWKYYGISAQELAQLDDWTIEVLSTLLTK